MFPTSFRNPCVSPRGQHNLHPQGLVGSAMQRLGEAMALVASLIGVGLALMYLFLVWMPSFKLSL